MIFESHAHYDDEQFDIDRDTLLEGLTEEGIEYIINVGANIKSSYECVKLAKKYDYIYAAIGVHPHDVKHMKEQDLESLIGLASYDKVVAIGEIGLDYYYDFSPRETQKLWFREQIKIAKDLELPIIIHSRDASKDTFDIIKESEAKQVGGVVHCYSGSYEMAVEYTKLGFYIGVGGVITFKNANKLKEVVKKIPIDNILIETDSPYLAPVPNRGKRNDSSNLKYIAQEISNIKNISYDDVINLSNKNAKRLFRID
jgi:TatD DNase family protein